MGADLWIVSGELEELKQDIVKLNGLIMANDIDWNTVSRVSEDIKDSAGMIENEADNELEDE